MVNVTTGAYMLGVGGRAYVETRDMPLIEPIYLDVLRLRQRKPAVTSIGAVRVATGGYNLRNLSLHILNHIVSL